MHTVNKTIRFLLTNDDYEDRTGVTPVNNDPSRRDRNGRAPNREAMECAVLGFRNFLRATPTSKEKGMIFGNDVSCAGDVVGKPVMQEAYEMGRSV